MTSANLSIVWWCVGSLSSSIVLSGCGSGAHIPREPDGATRCKNIDIPSLYAQSESARVAYFCHPETTNLTERWPLIVHFHGGASGGTGLSAYYPFIQAIAAQGLCVAAPASCEHDDYCHNGGSSFLEVLKTIAFVKKHAGDSLPAQMDVPVSVIGSSSGGRVALMLAALRDNPGTYLSSTDFVHQVTQEMWNALNTTGAFVADHPDPMDDPDLNPDVQHFAVNHSPVFIITGTEDNVEPKNSAWENFRMLSTKDKVFVNFHGEGHRQSKHSHSESSWIASFCKSWSLGDKSATYRIYGKGDGSITSGKGLPIAQAGEANTGDGIVGVLVCSTNFGNIPTDKEQYCQSSSVFLF